MEPKASVVIPTYNRPQLLRRAIGSVLAQTYHDFEIVVVDDGLEKRAREVVDGYADGRIRYVAHSENKGCSAAKNTGVRESRGKYIAFLDDDDEWMPEKLTVQLPALEGAPDDVGFSFHGALEVFDNGEYVKHVPQSAGDFLELALRNFSALIDSSMLYKREVFETVGYLDESFPTHTGAEFAIRVAKRFKGVGIDKPLVRREIRSGHVQMGSNIENRIRGREMLLARYKEEFEKRPTFLAKHLEQLARFYRDVGDTEKAREAFWQSFKLEPRFGRLAHTLAPSLSTKGL